MSLFDGFLTAFKAISANGLRSFLTMLGLLIGVGSVIILISIGQGTQAGIKEEITNLGTDLLFISPGSSSEAGVRGRRGSARTLFAEDVLAIREANLPGVEAAAPQLNIGNAQAIVGPLNQEIDLVGTDSDYLKVRNLSLSEGSFISSKDVLENLKQLKNTTYIVSSNGEELNENKEMFHVKQEKFSINSTNIRHIDVINVK